MSPAKSCESPCDWIGLIRSHFDASAAYWRDVYAENSLYGELYRERRQRVLHFFDRLAMPERSRVLEAGCGAGAITIALAQRGAHVTAVDPSPRMLHLTHESAQTAKLAHLIDLEPGDIQRLQFEPESFDAALAVGVMEWMPCFSDPLAELHRVLRPGGWLIANIDNSQALHCLLDPRMHPWCGPVKRWARSAAEKAGLMNRRLRSTRCSPARFDQALRAAGFEKVDSVTCGYGPMTILGIHFLPDSMERNLHARLQRLADHPGSLLKNYGDTYLTLARKCPTPPRR